MGHRKDVRCVCHLRREGFRKLARLLTEFNKRAGSFSREREENLLGSLQLAVTQGQ